MSYYISMTNTKNTGKITWKLLLSRGYLKTVFSLLYIFIIFFKKKFSYISLHIPIMKSFLLSFKHRNFSGSWTVLVHLAYSCLSENFVPDFHWILVYASQVPHYLITPLKFHLLSELLYHLLSLKVVTYSL